MANEAYDANKEYTREIEAILSERLGDRAERVSQDELDKLATWPDGLISGYELYGKYYRGDHGTLLTDRLKQYLERNARFEYNENYCELVVEALVSRLKVIGVTTSEDPEPAEDAPEPRDGPVPGTEAPEGPQVPSSFPKGATVKRIKAEPLSLSGWLWEHVWDGSQGDQKQTEVHRQSAVKGDAYVVVDFDPEKGKPVLRRNSPETCRVIYKGGEKHAAIKKWESNDKSPTNPAGVRVLRMNIYYPDRVEKWFKMLGRDGENKAGGWIEWMDDGDSVWPTPWVGPDNEPMGIPVFHFANFPDDEGMGRAEIRSVVPQQDRLNKELVDLSSVLDSQGFPQRWATGVTETSGLKSNPGEVWSTESESASFGQFDAADPAGLLKSIESTIVRLADRSRTPRYMLQLSGGTPSGEALKTAEAGFKDKVEDRQTFHGNQWGEVLRMSALVSHVYGGDGDPKPPCSFEDCQKASINVKWRDAQTKDEKAHLETLILMQTLGIPEEEIWSRIDGIDVADLREKKRKSDMENAATMMRAFDRGGDTNPAVDGQGMPGMPPKRPAPFGE